MASSGGKAFNVFYPKESGRYFKAEGHGDSKTRELVFGPDLGSVRNVFLSEERRIIYRGLYILPNPEGHAALRAHATVNIINAAKYYSTQPKKSSPNSQRSYEELIDRAKEAVIFANYEEASRLYIDAAKLNNDNPEPYELLGRLYWEKVFAADGSDLIKATQAYIAAIKRNGKAVFGVNRAKTKNGSFSTVMTITVTSTKCTFAKYNNEYAYETDHDALRAMVSDGKKEFYVFYPSETNKYFKAIGKGNQQTKELRFVGFLGENSDFYYENHFRMRLQAAVNIINAAKELSNQPKIVCDTTGVRFERQEGTTGNMIKGLTQPRHFCRPTFGQETKNMDSRSHTRLFGPTSSTAALVALMFLLVLVPQSTAQKLQDNRQLVQESRTAAQRLALVIGNGAYQSSKLKNPPNDATAVAGVLRDLGFDVTTGVNNRSQREMKQMIREFGQHLRANGGVGLFYFAGHGVQAKGRNYLIPIDADIQAEADLRRSGCRRELLAESFR